MKDRENPSTSNVPPAFKTDDAMLMSNFTSDKPPSIANQVAGSVVKGMNADGIEASSKVEADFTNRMAGIAARPVADMYERHYQNTADSIEAGNASLSISPRSQPKKSIDLIRSAAENGVAKAQGALGYEYESGLYLEKDSAKARPWYEKSAAQGNEQAKERLANLKGLME